VKISIEVLEGIVEPEVIIRCGAEDGAAQRLQERIHNLCSDEMTFYKGEKEFYFPVESIFFFETDGDRVYAHTAKDVFTVKHRLYALERLLPAYFVRAAKGAIVNTLMIYAINRNLASASKIQFSGTYKNVYASRHYYKSLKQKLEERSSSV